jgi:hypothetical protein
MNPLVAQFIAGLIRWLLTIVGGILVSNGIFTQDQMDVYTTQFALGIASALAGLIWMAYNTYAQRWKQLLGLEAPPKTPETVIEAQFKAGVKPITPLMSMANVPSKHEE